MKHWYEELSPGIVSCILAPMVIVTREAEKQSEKVGKHRIKSYVPGSPRLQWIRNYINHIERTNRSSDAAHFPGGSTPEVVKIIGKGGAAEVSAIMQRAHTILPIGAQSSLTGGATPNETVVLDMSQQEKRIKINEHTVTTPAGMTLRELQEALSTRGLFYPPVPTYDGATVGGVIATNAAGANTFKYGQTREWVDGITVVLANGETLDIKRGQCIAHGPDIKHRTNYFEVEDSHGKVITLPVPSYTMPHVAKISAGYFAKPKMDVIDLFIGSEGTLGVITEATLKVIPRPETAWALIPCESNEQALAITKDLRELRTSKTTRKYDRSTLDLSAIEYIDKNSLTLVRKAGKWAPKTAQTVLLAQIEMTPQEAATVYEDLGQVYENAEQAPHVPVVRFAQVLQKHGVLENDELGLAMPGETKEIERFKNLREAVPEIVNAINKTRSVQKVAGDMVVPFDKLGEMMRLFEERLNGFDYAMWGHISDGNMHPNVMAKSPEEVDTMKMILNDCGRGVIRMGGSPLAEHGVGKNPVKQTLLAALYGKQGINQMRAVKRALDPEGKLAPGNLFPLSGETRRN